ncbi:unnamed protein product, partial [Staurois parvus]
RPIIGVRERNSTPSVVSVAGIAPHHWCQWQELRPIIVRGRNCAPSLVTVGGIAPHHWYQWGELRPIIGISGGIVPHRWCWGNSAPSLCVGEEE